MNKTTKRRFRMLSVFAMLMVIGCFCFTAMGASALSAPSTPTIIHNKGYVFLQVGFRTNTNNTLLLGTDINPNYGYDTLNDNEYYEVNAPYKMPTYYWAIAVAPNGEQSSRQQRNGDISAQAVPDAYLSSGSFFEYTFNINPSSNDNLIKFTFAYQGDYVDGFMMLPSTGENSANVVLNGVTCTVMATNSRVTMELDQTLTFSTCSSTTNNKALFGFVLTSL